MDRFTLVKVAAAVFVVWLVLSYFPNNENSSEEIVQDEEVSVGAPTNSGADCSSSRRHERPGFHNGPRFQYVHIPKAGGTSIQAAMVHWANTNHETKLYLTNEASVHGSSFVCPPNAYDASILIGHRGWGYCRGVEQSSKGLVTFAVLRSAVSRMLSLYDYNLRTGTRRATRLFRDKDLSQLVKHYNSTPEVEEGEFILRYSGSQQCRFMCGYECMGPNAFHNATLTPEYMCEQAKMKLAKTDVVGITEELNSVLHQLKFHTNIVPHNLATFPPPLKKKKTHVDEEASAIMSEWGKYDQDLYESAKQIYHSQNAIAQACLASHTWPSKG